MRAMVERLTVIGLPGDGGYWQMANDLFDIDWDLLDERDIIVITNSVGLERSPKLTAREAAALLTGLQLARTIPGVGDTELFAGLLAKLARGASSTPADVIVAPGPVDAVRDAVAEALQRGVAVSFTYKAPDAAPTTRTVDPVKVHIATGEWYLQGWCHLRAGDADVPPRPRQRPRAHRHPHHARRGAGSGLVRRPDAGDVVARIRFPASVAPLLGDYLDRATVETIDGISIATMRVADELQPAPPRRASAAARSRSSNRSPHDARRPAWAEAGLAQYR